MLVVELLMELLLLWLELQLLLLDDDEDSKPSLLLPQLVDRDERLRVFEDERGKSCGTSRPFENR